MNEEQFSMFDFTEEISETTLIGDEWNSYYESECYDDQSWSELGGVNAEENQLLFGDYITNPFPSYSTTPILKDYRDQS